MWHMHKVSTRISLRSLIRDDAFRINSVAGTLLYTRITHRREMSGGIRLCDLRKMIWVDTLHRYHIVGFLAMQLIWNLKTKVLTARGRDENY